MQSIREVDGDIVNHWYILALENEVPKDKPIKRILYDQAFVLFRNQQGEIGVMPDRCLHRGAQLSLGKIVDGSIRCPYHGWRFASDGTLLEVPSDGPTIEAAELNKKRGWCTTKVPFKVQDGCVWIWPGGSDKLTEGPSWRFPEFQNKDVVQYFMTTDFENEVTHLVQNFMDVPHTVFVHSKWFRNRALLKVPIDIDVQNGRVKVTYKQESDSIGFTARILNPENAPMIHTDEFIFPNITRVDYKFGNRFFIINSQCSPISRYQTRVYTWIAYDIGWLSALFKPFMSFYTRQVIQQDVEIMQNQGRNFKQYGEGEFRNTQADELHIAIDKMRQTGTQDRHEPLKMQFNRQREFWI